MKLDVPKEGMIGEIKRIYQKLQIIENSLNNDFAVAKLTVYGVEVAKLYEQIVAVQLKLNDVQNLMNTTKKSEYQRYIDLTFSKINIVSEKLNVARKTTTRLAKEGKITSNNDIAVICDKII